MTAQWAICVLNFAFAAAQPGPGGWDRQKAFEYLETRQREWAEWKPAQKHGGACISCHTGLSYLMARRVLAEARPRPLERDLVEGVKARVLADTPQKMLSEPGAEAVLNLLAVSFQRRSAAEPLDAAEQIALRRLWEIQIRSGEAKGAWTWIIHDLHPVESENSAYFGAALAQRALSAYPAGPPDRADALRDYLRREAARQPLHNRLAWIAFTPGLDDVAKSGVLRDLWAAQSSDGGLSAASLGPWAAHPSAPPDVGSQSYATAWAAFTARQSGVACSDPRLQRAMNWLKQRQDRASGAWPAVSMNKIYPEGSMQLRFMTDTATGYATAALISCQLE